MRRIHNLGLNLAKYHPLAVNRYIPLPLAIAAKKALSNIKNKDEQCLVWFLFAHKINLSFKDNANQVTKYTESENKIRVV